MKNKKQREIEHFKEKRRDLGIYFKFLAKKPLTNYFWQYIIVKHFVKTALCRVL